MLPAIADLPPQIQERVVCSITAAMNYKVPANVILAVASQEAGKPGQWVKNSNGTYDVGAMQFNTAYLKEIKHIGATPAAVAAKGCYPYDLATWRIANHIKNDKGDIWTKAANYHSKTPEFNKIYKAKIIKRGAKWAKWLKANFSSVQAIKTGGVSPAPYVATVVPFEAVKNTPAPKVERQIRLSSKAPQPYKIATTNNTAPTPVEKRKTSTVYVSKTISLKHQKLTNALKF